MLYPLSYERRKTFESTDDDAFRTVPSVPRDTVRRSRLARFGFPSWVRVGRAHRIARSRSPRTPAAPARTAAATIQRLGERFMSGRARFGRLCPPPSLRVAAGDRPGPRHAGSSVEVPRVTSRGSRDSGRRPARTARGMWCDREKAGATWRFDRALKLLPRYSVGPTSQACGSSPGATHLDRRPRYCPYRRGTMQRGGSLEPCRAMRRQTGVGTAIPSNTEERRAPQASP
jgi:hypothetical protein